MGLSQLNFEGRNKIEIAIMRIQQFEPLEGYYLAFSGGKDSVVLLALAKETGVRYDAHYSLTTIDPPELVKFIKTFPEVSIEYPEKSMYRLIEEKGLPRRQGRWCCEKLKENGGSGRIVLTGIRWAESNKRAHRGMVESCYKDTTKRYVHPIIDWNQAEIWEYIGLRELDYCSLYDEGFQRLGCILCPMTRDIERQMARFPKTVEAIRRAAFRYWARQTKGGQKFPTFESFWEWWLDRDASVNEPAQKMMFDSYEAKADPS